MSYLNAVRLVFSGRFQADPSTVNNDVRHYDIGSFKDAYQGYPKDGADNGWWNPSGSSAFRLIDCVVRAVHYADGTGADTRAADSVVGLSILDANDRTSGKIVDLDPQWQLASQIWGMKVRLADITAAAPATYVSGRFVENPFHDLWFSRVSGLGGDRAASAVFQSVLADLDWSAGLPGSRFLPELQAALREGMLSIRLVTYAYRDDHAQPGFTFGTVSGVIGPYLTGEPQSFVAGRRFAPQFGATSWNNLSFCSGTLDAAGRLLIDLGNAMPLDGDYEPMDLGVLTAGSLLAGATPEGAPAGTGNYQQIGVIPYRDPDWLLRTGGIADLLLNRNQQSNQPPNGACPLALATQPAGAGTPVIALRETPNGLFTGAEPFVLRIDSDADGAVTATSTLYATAFGQPVPFATLTVAQVGEMDGLGGGADGADQPTAPFPPAGIPMSALAFAPTLATGLDGTAALTIQATPPNNARGYIDGQLYNINYQQAGQARSAFGPFEVIAIHLRDAYPVPEAPSWAEHIRPIFEQYGNLYPIMSRRLVQLSEPASIYRNRNLLTLAFSLDIEDANYMPVTRDLSEGKRRTVLAWLARIEADAGFKALLGSAPAEAAQPAPPTAAVPPQEPPAGGKTEFARSLARSRAGQRSA